MQRQSIQHNWQALLTPEIVALLTQIHEFKGAQNFLIGANGDALSQLAEAAKVQGIEASNRMEGVYTSDERLKKIILDKTTPRTKHEQEIAGYRDVLTTILENYAYIPLRPAMILQLHRDLYKFSGTSAGGQYRSDENSAAEALELACHAYDEAIQSGADPLLSIPLFILDFLCIHPFHTGNGRMSRLLTLLLLFRSGYHVGKYVSIEKLIEQRKEAYDEAIQRSSDGWRENRQDAVPFVRYLLRVIVSAYRDFSSRAQRLTAKGLSKPERIRELIQSASGKITKAEIMEQCPDISQVTVQRALIELQNNHEITKLSGGRYTAYLWNGEKNEQ